MSGKFVEQRIAKRREQEAKDLDMRRRVTEYNILTGHGTSAIRVENKRRARSEAQLSHELFMDYSHVQAQQDKTRKTQIAQFEEHLADELARRKAKEQREEMDKLRICAGSEELRALKERLHMAKVNKERSQQLLEIGTREEEERVREKHIADHMENERLEHIELEHKLHIEKTKQRERVKTINQQQIAMKEASRQEALQEYLKEREQVQELVDKIAREDAEEAAARHSKQVETKATLRQFMIDQKEKQEQMERDEQEEFARIEKYAREKREREERLAQEHAQREAEKGRILKDMLGKMEAKSKEAGDLEQLRNDLHLEELQAEGRRREEMQVRKILEDREDMKNAYLYQMRMKEERAKAAAEEEAGIRNTLLAKFAEDDRLEQMNEQKRRMKQEEHKREAERLIKLRRDMYDQQREAERQADHDLKSEESKRQIIIEEERRRLIKEHASELRSFLPKGTLETMDDYQLMFNDESK